jgi:undecaprenyl-diphosphatase
MRNWVGRIGAAEANWIHRLDELPVPAWLGGLLRRLTHLGGATATLGASVLMLASPALRSLGIVTLVANVGSHLVVQLLKRSIARRRPALAVDGLEALEAAPDAWSFPSGHAAAATAVALPFALAGHPLSPGLLAAALLVGASRVYLRVHFPSDVAVGHTLGAVGAVLAWIALA